ncbi:hypothetical protein VNO77_19569 [Canavalia gladiata]|uniref:Uncharacterized protein n=1 Tax=Canavalia gladiata TaxID=3824 RepID=A0AAN9LMR6_CANGL
MGSGVWVHAPQVLRLWSNLLKSRETREQGIHLPLSIRVDNPLGYGSNCGHVISSSRSFLAKPQPQHESNLHCTCIHLAKDMFGYLSNLTKCNKSQNMPCMAEFVHESQYPCYEKNRVVDYEKGGLVTFAFNPKRASLDQPFGSVIPGLLEGIDKVEMLLPQSHGQTGAMTILTYQRLVALEPRKARQMQSRPLFWNHSNAGFSLILDHFSKLKLHQPNAYAAKPESAPLSHI